MATLTESDIRKRTDEGRFKRGKEYRWEGAVKDQVRREGNLEASVKGSYPQPYRVSVSFSDDGTVKSTSCSCPDDYYGDCKHVVAVLLDWLDNDDEFKEVEPVEKTLEGRSKKELTLLIQEMLERDPSLKRLLDEPLPGFSGSPGSTETVDRSLYRQDVRNILEGYNGRGDEWDVATSLKSLVEKGKRHLDNKELGEAEAIFEMVVKETLDLYGQIYGHESGEIYGAIDDAIDGLIGCLKASPEKTEIRREVVDVLFWVIEWDIDFGGIDLMDEGRKALMESTDLEDRERLREKMIEILKGSFESRWRKNRYGTLLLELCELDGSTEDFIEKLDEFGIEIPKLEALTFLELGRKDEAVESASKINSPLDVKRVADQLRERGYGEDARELVSDHVQEEPDDRLKEWLVGFDKRDGNFKSALEMEIERFRSRPSSSKFEQVVGIAEELGKKKEYRSELIDELKEEEKFNIVAEIYLKEEKLEKAWGYAERYEETKKFGNCNRLKEKIVEAGKNEKPDRAVEFYLDRVYDLISKRGRKNYRKAAEYLVEVRDIYEEDERKEGWDDLIESLREEFDNLPACQDEFDKAGL